MRNTAQDECLTGWKSMRSGVPFTWNHLNRKKNVDAQPFNNLNAKIKVKFLAGRVQNLTGVV